jgi:CubicO group peptidase (beta-lactamase class C family)
MPAGGLFSTATDVARFCQMILNGGEFEGRRYLSAAAVQQMTSRQTPAGLEQSYGFGWAPGGNGFAHGGAYSTMMSVDTKHSLVTVFMVQVAGWRNKEENGKVHSTFQKAAAEEFGK